MQIQRDFSFTSFSKHVLQDLLKLIEILTKEINICLDFLTKFGRILPNCSNVGDNLTCMYVLSSPTKLNVTIKYIIGLYIFPQLSMLGATL